jgi:hypothetical protein
MVSGLFCFRHANRPSVPRAILCMEALAGYWQPPSAIERGPYEARLRGNWPVYYDSVADLHPPAAAAHGGSTRRDDLQSVPGPTDAIRVPGRPHRRHAARPRSGSGLRHPRPGVVRKGPGARGPGVPRGEPRQPVRGSPACDSGGAGPVAVPLREERPARRPGPRRRPHPLARDFAGTVSADHWRAAAERVVRLCAEEATEPRLTPDGVTRGRATSPSHLAAESTESTGSSAGSPATRLASGPTAYCWRVRTSTPPKPGTTAAPRPWLAGVWPPATAPSRRARPPSSGPAASYAPTTAPGLSSPGRCLHFDEEEFGEYGAPLHGGIAPGVDRIVMLLADEPNIQPRKPVERPLPHLADT